MARLSPEQWAEVRKDREETGTSYRALAARYGVSDAAIIKRAKAEKWGNSGGGAGNHPEKSKRVSKVSTKVSANRKVSSRANRKRKPMRPVEELEELPPELVDKAIPLDEAESIPFDETGEGQERGRGAPPQGLTLTRTRVATFSLEGDFDDSPLRDIYKTDAPGRTKYRRQYAPLAYKHALLGATPLHVASLLEVSEQTVYDWMGSHPEFRAAMEQGRRDADANVARSLYKKATGYTHQAMKVFQYQGEPVVVPYVEVVPPDTEAAKFWLKNRQPDQWKEKVEIEEKPTFALVDKDALQQVYQKALEHAAQVEQEMQGRAERLGLIIDHDAGGVDG